MSGDTPASPRQRLFFGLMFVVVGVAICLPALGIVKPSPHPDEAPFWLIGLIGLAFALAGGWIMLGAGAANDDGSLPDSAPLLLRIAQYLMALTIIATLAITASWVSFGPGERHFTSSIGFGGMSSAGHANASLGRIMFGFGAILTWLMFVLIAVQGARKFLRTDNAPPSS